jgi:hypothetical protein
LSLFVILLALSPAHASDDVDLAVVHRIKNEAFRNSQVMDHMFALSDRFGPRVSGSPAYRAAAEWTVGLLEGWGLRNAGLEGWGEFGRGWSLERFSAHMVEPVYARLSGIPGAWTSGTNGTVTANVVEAHLYESEEDRAVVQWDLEKRADSLREYAAKYKGKLRGKIVLLYRPRDLELATEPEGIRHDAESLAEKAEAPEPLPAESYEWPMKSLPTDPQKRSRLFARSLGNSVRILPR